MRIEAVGFQTYQPYIYNTNTLSGNSMSRVKPIGDDLLASRTDFSGMAEEEQNLNPLRKGETLNFADVIAMQMQMGRMNADKVMKPAEKAVSEVPAAGPDGGRASGDVGLRTVRMIDAAGEAETAENRETAGPGPLSASLYQLKRAAFAYQMNMIA